MIISSTLLLLILLPIFASLLLSLPIIQNRLIFEASKYASSYLNTEVSLKYIDVTPTGAIKIQDLLVRDLQNDTLLFVTQLDTRLLGYSIIEKKLSLGRSRVRQATLNLQERDEGDMNIRQIVKMFIKEEREAKFQLNISSIDLYSTKLIIERKEHRPREFGVDVGNIILEELSARVEQLNVLGDNVRATIKNLSATEQSGFTLSDVASEMLISNGTVELNDLSLSSRWSALKVKQMRLSDSDWFQYKNFITSTSLYIDVDEGYVSSDDVAYFSPILLDWGVQLKDLDVVATGRVDSLKLNIKNASYGDSTQIAATVLLEGLPAIEETKADVQIKKLVSNLSDIEALNYTFSKSYLDAKAAEVIAKAGNIELEGNVSGILGDLKFDLESLSELGQISTDMRVEWPYKSGYSEVKIMGEVAFDGLKLNMLTPKNSALGGVSLKASLNGSLDSVVGNDMSIISSISSLNWKGYDYRNIDIAGRLSSDNIRATASCNDPNLIFGMTAAIENVNMVAGSSNILSERSKSTLSLNLMYADLKALGLSRNNEKSTLAVDVSLNTQGGDIERVTGDVALRRVRYTTSDNIIETDSASLLFINKADGLQARFDSEFATALFESPDSVVQIAEYLSNAFRPYLPAIYSERNKNITTYYPKFSRAIDMINNEAIVDTIMLEHIVAMVKSNNMVAESQIEHPHPNVMSHLNIKILDMEPILKTFDDNISISKESFLDLAFDTHSKMFAAKAYSKSIERKSTAAIEVNMDIYNDADSIILNGSIQDLFVGSLNMSNVRVDASAQENRIAINSGFTNIDSTSFADINAGVRLSRSTVSGSDRQEISLTLHPSHIQDQRALWSLYARSIDIKHSGIDIDKFIVESDNQRLSIDGRASTSVTDTVDMSMYNFDLSVLTTFIERLGYRLDGETNGHIRVASALENASIEADIKLDNVKANAIPAPPMTLSATWDSKMNRARLTLVNRNNNGTLLRGYYIPSQMIYYANLKVDEVDMSLIDPPLNGIITNTVGEAKVDLTLQGERRKASIEGTIDIVDCQSVVDYTKVRYYIPKAKLTVKNNNITGKNIAFNDGLKGSGKMNISVNMQYLTNIEYSLQLNTNNLLVLNTTERDNDVFYGTLYSSGKLALNGDRNGSKMDLAAVSEDNSHFFMQILGKSTISSADFITFVEPEVEVIDDAATRRRQLIASRSRVQGGPSTMEINMSLDVHPNTEVQLVIDPTVGDVIKSRGEGNFNIKINPNENIFEMYGDYTISEGSYLFTLSNIINKKFVIEPNSSIMWNGSPTDAILNIDAIYNLKTSIQPLVSTESTRAVPVECVINLSNTLTHPDVGFKIQFPTLDSEQQAVVSTALNDEEVVSRQFFYLMLANSFISESSGFDSDMGVSTTASTGFELLTNQLSNWLSTSNYNIIIRYRPESELTGEEVDIGFSRGLINNRLLLEVEGNYVSNSTETLSENGSSNFVGEAYLTWLIDRAGALRLRGFTQTIDRYDENQGLQETGIGVSYSENFENLTDLRAKVKARFAASPERIKRRESRKAEREAEREAKISAESTVAIKSETEEESAADDDLE